MVGLVAGGYMRPRGGSDILLSSTELFSPADTSTCNYSLPDLPVSRRGMFGGDQKWRVEGSKCVAGWLGGRAVVCGGEDGAGQVAADCFHLAEGEWQESEFRLAEGRSYAAVDTSRSDCLLVAGGTTQTGFTAELEVITEYAYKVQCTGREVPLTYS